MSGTPDETLRLDHLNRYIVDVTITDPSTESSFTVECEVDTGNPVGFAIPDSYESEISNSQYIGTRALGGAAKGKGCKVYQARVSMVGSTPCNHDTAVYLALNANSHDHGLIGIEFLKNCISRMHDGPSDPVFEMSLTHVH